MSLGELLARGSAPIRHATPDFERLTGTLGKEAADSLRPLLSVKNGFYCFEGALLVLPDDDSAGERGLVRWTSDDLWRVAYQGMAREGAFFAADAFGGQFCIREGKVWAFDPETGAFEVMADGLEDWANTILEDYGVWTGYPVAHEWQAAHGRIPAGSRLVPRTPFVLGGEYSTDNLYSLEAAEGMRYRASIAIQIKDLPDGQAVTLKVT